MKLPKELTTVTPFSKYLAMVVFIALPIVGFFLGMRYQEMIDPANKEEARPTKPCTLEAKICPDGTSVGRQGSACEFAPCPTIDPGETANWKTYSDELFTFRYPEDWIVGPVQIFGLRSEVEFSYQNNPVFTLAKIANYNNGTQKPFATLEEFIGTRVRNVKEILLADQKAKYVVDPGIEGHVIPYEEVVSFSPDRSFIISLYYQKQSYADFLQAYEKSRADKVINQILSTFKFTTP